MLGPAGIKENRDGHCVADPIMRESAASPALTAASVRATTRAGPEHPLPITSATVAATTATAGLSGTSSSTRGHVICTRSCAIAALPVGGARNVLTLLAVGLTTWLYIGVLTARLVGAFVNVGRQSWEEEDDLSEHG